MEQLFWQAPEYIHTKKTSDWYWIVGIVTLSLALIAIILNDVIFAILIIISVATLTLYASRPPHTLSIKLTHTGIYIDDDFHSYTELDSFWVDLKTPFPKIILKSKKKVSLFIHVFIEEIHPLDVQDFLSLYLPQVEHTEPLFEKILMYLGF